ncbi:MAG TPA: ATP synthase F1 subunit delta [Salinimicrobium sp.]|nr:ATP synthase F1 subunit delta [Salinimicrobium sp.]
MAGTRAAQRYAKAILGMAEDQNLTEKVNDDMKLVSNTIEANNNLRVILKSPVVKSDLKKNALHQIFKDSSAITLGAFNLLLENKRIAILKEVADKYIFLYNQKINRSVAFVTTAVALTPGLEAMVRSKVKEITGNEVTLKNIIDKDIVGGFILRVGDLQYDASIKNKLNDLKREFTNNTYISKL